MNTEDLRSLLSTAGDAHFAAGVIWSLAARYAIRRQVKREDVIVIGTGGDLIGWPKGARPR